MKWEVLDKQSLDILKKHDDYVLVWIGKKNQKIIGIACCIQNVINAIMSLNMKMMILFAITLIFF